MSNALASVLEAVKSLSEAERDELINRLLENSDVVAEAETPIKLSPAWMVELKHRSDEIDSGKAEFVSREEIDRILSDDPSNG